MIASFFRSSHLSFLAPSRLVQLGIYGRRGIHGIMATCFALTLSCSDDDGEKADQTTSGTVSGIDTSTSGAMDVPSYLLTSIVIGAEDTRTTYAQVISSFENGNFDNKNAIEVPGNGTILTVGRNFMVGLMEEPTWVRYNAAVDGKITETGRINFAHLGARSIDYGNVIVDATHAVSILTEPAMTAVFWNPETMLITGTLPLNHLAREGYNDLEVYTTFAHEGRVYVPLRWANWEAGSIYPESSMMILDPFTMQEVAIANDARCASGGRIVVGSDGYMYVMGDGRTYSIQLFASIAGTTAPDNCLLRIAPGATVFDPNYYYTIPSLTGGLQSITELDGVGDGFGFAKMFYPAMLDAPPTDFEFWSKPVHKMWRLTLADPPLAQEVQGAPFSIVGFTATSFDGKLYLGESENGSRSQVYEIDPQTNTSTMRFQMDGYFYGLQKLSN